MGGPQVSPLTVLFLCTHNSACSILAGSSRYSALGLFRSF